MLKYYKPSPAKPNPKIEKCLPIFMDLDSPIPEELSVDYEFAKYDMNGLIPEPKSGGDEYKEVLTKY